LVSIAATTLALLPPVSSDERKCLKAIAATTLARLPTVSSDAKKYLRSAAMKGSAYRGFS